MNRKELYAWCSLGFALAVMIYYFVSVFGWPDAAEPYAGRVTGLLWKVIVITVAVELVLDVMGSMGIGVAEDERDRLIEGKAFRNTYYLFSGALIVLIVHLLINDYLGQSTGETMLLALPYVTVHALVSILLMAVIVKSSTQLYFYHREV